MIRFILVFCLLISLVGCNDNYLSTNEVKNRIQKEFNTTDLQYCNGEFLIKTKTQILCVNYVKVDDPDPTKQLKISSYVIFNLGEQNGN